MSKAILTKFSSHFLLDAKPLPERSFWTVYVGDKEKTNIAVALVDQGLATVVQHRGDEDRSREYELLVLAENNAKSKVQTILFYLRTLIYSFPSI